MPLPLSPRSRDLMTFVRYWALVESVLLKTHLRSFEPPSPLPNFCHSFMLWIGFEGLTDQKRGGTFFADSIVGEAYLFLESNIAYLQLQSTGGPYDNRIGFADMSSMKWRAASGWGGRPIAPEYDAEAAMTLSSNDKAEILGQLDAEWAVIAQAFGLPAPPRTVLAEQIRSGLSRR